MDIDHFIFKSIANLLVQNGHKSRIDNKVSFFARVIDLESGESGDLIYNKYEAVDSDLEDPEEPALLPEEME